MHASSRSWLSSAGFATGSRRNVKASSYQKSIRPEENDRKGSTCQGVLLSQLSYCLGAGRNLLDLLQPPDGPVAAAVTDQKPCSLPLLVDPVGVGYGRLVGAGVVGRVLEVVRHLSDQRGLAYLVCSGHYLDVKARFSGSAGEDGPVRPAVIEGECW